MSWDNSPPSSTGARKSYLAIAVAIALAGGIGWWLYTRNTAPSTAAGDEAAFATNSDGSITLTSAQLNAQGIETANAVTAKELPVPGLPAQAMAPLEASAQVVAPYPGIVTRVLVDEGAAVEKGQALAYIQSHEMLAAQGELTRARIEANAASQQARRDAALLAEGIIAAARNEQSQARNASAQSALRQAEGALAPLRPVRDGQAGEYELLAPMGGQVIRRHLTPGQATSAQSIAFVVAEPGIMDVVFSAPLRLQTAVARGASVRLPNGSIAQVVAVGADADPSSQSLRIRARLESTGNQGLAYVAGQEFSVTLLLPAPGGAFAVPPAALLPAGDEYVLFVAQKDTAGDRVRIHAVAVNLLGGDEHASIVSPSGSRRQTSALTTGATVVTRGTSMLKSMIPLQ